MQLYTMTSASLEQQVKVKEFVLQCPERAKNCKGDCAPVLQPPSGVDQNSRGVGIGTVIVSLPSMNSNTDTTLWNGLMFSLQSTIVTVRSTMLVRKERNSGRRDIPISQKKKDHS